MKKKTVITTETHEVWVIRQTSGEVLEGEIGDSEKDRSPNPLSRSRTESAVPEMPSDEQN